MHRLFLWRREGDLNPRTGVTRLLVFEASPFSLLGTSPQMRYLMGQTIKICSDNREGHYSIGTWCTQVVASDVTTHRGAYYTL